MKRLLLVAVLVTISAELTLQLLGLVLPRFLSRAERPEGGEGRATILCIGDSHTYGAPLPAEESYPAQLQERLDTRAPGEFRVVNLGVPGMNTPMMARRLEQNLSAYRPELVILWAGINNSWNEKEAAEWDEQDASPLRVLRELKLVRLVRFLRSDVGDVQPGRQAVMLEYEPGSHSSFQLGDEVLVLPSGSTEPSVARAATRTRKDLPAIIRLARSFGVPVLLVTYPYPNLAPLNDAIREIARELDVPLVESEEALERAQRDGHGLYELIVMAAGPHPRRLLYGYIVEDMLPQVLAALGAR